MNKQVLRITNGRIIDPAGKRDETGDLLVVNGQIRHSLTPAQEKAAREIDASGLVVCPGLVDIHVHLREPGQTHKETIGTGTEASAAGGFTTIVCMPNTSPPADNAGTIQYILDVIKRDAVVNVLPTGCITERMEGQNLAPIGSLKRAGVVAITDDGLCVQNNEIMRRAVEYADMFDLLVMDHCQDAALTARAVMNEGDWSLRLGLKGWPGAAEDVIVSRNVILSTLTGARIHCQHISSANAVDIIRRAKQRGVPISAEACPHHLALTDACLKTYDTHFKMNPPLRTDEDRRAIIEGIKDGTLDCIATDHAPHTNYEKDQEFDYAPFGITGLETALAVSMEILYHGGELTLMNTLELLTSKPAGVVGIKKGTLEAGADADITIFDPDETWEVDPARFFSKSANSPWNYQSLKGRVKTTLVGGKVVFDRGKIIR